MILVGDFKIELGINQVNCECCRQKILEHKMHDSGDMSH